MKPKYIILLVTSLVVLLVDQITKIYVHSSMELYNSIPVIGGLFNITYMRNRGAAFSFMAGFNYRTPLLITVSVIAIIAILIVLSKLRNDQKLAAFSFSLIMSGAMGNLIDRVRLGEVIDFLDVQWKGHHWPAFNIADSAICIGVALLIIDMFLESSKKRKLGQTP
ncbi:MAG: signal peptidase II [Desulfuromonadales bacterium]|nr:signal peptidase II [Desulfuromonadales bacterium]